MSPRSLQQRMADMMVACREADEIVRRGREVFDSDVIVRRGAERDRTPRCRGVGDSW